MKKLFSNSLTQEWWSTASVLNDREIAVIKHLDQEYRRRYCEQPAANENLVYFLGDRVEWGKTWSAHSGKLPTFRRNKGFYVQRKGLKLLTPSDKLLALGWPVSMDTAASMQVPPLPSLDLKRADLMAGNAMHLGNSSVVLFIGLSCFGRQCY